MRTLKALIVTLVSVLLLTSALTAAADLPKGPQADELYFIIITDNEARLRALQLGEIHIYPGLTTPETIDTFSLIRTSN